jgi:DNA repair protein RadD
VMGAPEIVGNVVDTWLAKAERRSTVVFAVGVHHARSLLESFQLAGVRAGYLDGTTPEMEREQVLVDLELGGIEVVVNVGVLCEGWDQPSVKCCVDAAPTMSLSRYMQKAGRILRPYGGVTPILLDHAGNVSRHGLPHDDRIWSLEGKAERASKTHYRVCGRCFAYVETMPCPLCGNIAERKERKLKLVPGELVEIGAAKPTEMTPDRLFFEGLVAEARRKGWKPGAVSFRYKERYGHWPKWPLGVDDAWRKAIESNQKRKAWEAEREAEKANRPAPSALKAEKVLGRKARAARKELPSQQTTLPLDAPSQTE